MSGTFSNVGANFSFNGAQAKGAADPTDPQDLVTLAYGTANFGAGTASGNVATDPIWDAKGDLAVGTAANLATRLAVGTADGQVLTVAAAEPTGIYWVKVGEAMMALTDETTQNATTGRHGFLKKLPNNAAQYMDGTGNWSTPTGTAPGVAADTIWDAAGDIAVGTGADTAAKLALGTSGKVLQSNGSTVVYGFPPGYELAYVEKTTNTTVTGTTSAGATTVVTCPGFTADGSTRIRIEFYAYAVTFAADGFTNFVLYEGSTELGLIGELSVVGSTTTTDTGDNTLQGALFLTPASGTRTYSLRAWRSVSNTTIIAGDGLTAGAGSPTFLRVTVA